MSEVSFLLILYLGLVLDNKLSHFAEYQLLGTSLAIRAVNKDDHGFYHCIARSEAGQAIGVRRVVVKRGFPPPSLSSLFTRSYFLLQCR